MEEEGAGASSVVDTEEENAGASSADDMEEGESAGASSADDTEEESPGSSSSVDDTEEEESGGSSSENETEIPANKWLELNEKEDLISALPDSLIHHILSFLPSTKEAIQTGILSKRWQNQWTRVSVLIFDSTGKSDRNFSQFIDRTLTQHDCSKIKKFHIIYDRNLESDPQLTSKIHFAIRKYAEELILHLYGPENGNNLEDMYSLPQIVFSNTSLVKLELFKCYLNPNWIINWPRLKELKLECSSLYDSAIQNVLSGTPLLESLNLTGSIRFPNIVIASKSLKRLMFSDIGNKDGRERIEILCPNLEELSFMEAEYSGFTFTELPNQTIENALSRSPLLRTLELQECACSERLVIASKSLKKLVLGDIHETTMYEISCPNLEELDLYHFLPSAFSSEYFWFECCEFAIKILRQLRHVNLLKLGGLFIKVLLILELEGLSLPVLKCKFLTLEGLDFDENFPGILCAIRHSPALEKLVINLSMRLDIYHMYGDFPDLNGARKNYWNSNGTNFNCSMSNLKTVKILGLSEGNGGCKFLFKFVEFLLKNARILEKIVVILDLYRPSFLLKLSKKLLSFRRCFPHTTVELLCSDFRGFPKYCTSFIC